MKKLLLTFNRFGRVQFLAYTNITHALAVLIYYFSFGFEELSLNEFFTNHPFATISFGLISLLQLKFLAQRYRDTGLNGWWALVGLIPYAPILLYLGLGLFRGESHANHYGEVPTSPGLVLKLIAFVPWLIGALALLWYFLIR